MDSWIEDLTGQYPMTTWIMLSDSESFFMATESHPRRPTLCKINLFDECGPISHDWLPSTYVAAYEAMANAKRVTPALIQPICVGNMSMPTSYT
jgi:hypothetical protein